MQTLLEWNVPLALLAGAILAVMIDWNSQLALHSSPLIGAWLVHGIGVVAAAILVALRPTPKPSTQGSSSGRDASPLWSYLGGIPGAFTVLLAAITVNGPLGLAGTLAVMLVGQMLFGITVDQIGWFALIRRRLVLADVVALALVFAGSLIIILSRS